MMELFDLETIAVNKRGEKTEKQVKDIKFGTNPIIWGAVGLLLFGFYAFIAALNPDLWKSAWWILPLLEFIPVMRAYAFWKARRKALNDKVIAITGTVAYDSSSGCYVAKADNGSVLSSSAQNLPPGKYRFYCPEKEGGWLSVEPLSSEGEMRANLNDALASAFGYGNEHLENCRRQAGAGKLKTAEGALTINMTSGDEYSQPNPESLTVGEVTFDIPKQGFNALLEKIPYRAYYREEEDPGLMKQIADMVLSRKKNLEAIESV